MKKNTKLILSVVLLLIVVGFGALLNYLNIPKYGLYSLYGILK